MSDASTAFRFGLPKRLAAEALGSALLLAVVVGSGIMAERLADGNVGLALLANALTTGAAFVVLVTIFGPVSGAHLNPAVTLALVLRHAFPRKDFPAYATAQMVGAVLGVWLAHAMFGEPLLQMSAKSRSGPGQALSEAVATFGLLATILGAARFRPDFTAIAVGLYISAAYWFTASTSFANPAATLARSLSDSFVGIAPESVPAFIAAQACGAVLAVLTFGWLFKEDDKR